MLLIVLYKAGNTKGGSITVQSVILLSVVMLNVMAPLKHPHIEALNYPKTLRCNFSSIILRPQSWGWVGGGERGDANQQLRQGSLTERDGSVQLTSSYLLFETSFFR